MHLNNIDSYDPWSHTIFPFLSPFDFFILKFCCLTYRFVYILLGLFLNIHGSIGAIVNVLFKISNFNTSFMEYFKVIEFYVLTFIY